MPYNFDYKNTKYNSLPTFQECFNALERRMDDAQRRIDKLVEENEHLKSEAYKDNELAKMQKELNRTQADLYRGFSLTQQEYDNAHTWIVKHNNEVHSGSQHGAIGGGYEYRFIPTSMGIIGQVVCSFCGMKYTFQDL